MTAATASDLAPPLPPAGTGFPYTVVVIAAILVSAAVWCRMFRRDSDLPLIYVGGLAAAFAGAKVAYLAAEGWLHLGSPNALAHLATGKSILGALLGGYVGVEFTKKLLGYRAPTGDVFALTVPPALAFGRAGCLLHGCCPGRVCPPSWWTVGGPDGVARWPAVQAEIAFNLLAVPALLYLRRFPAMRGQLFHLYLIAYGLFRFGHEFLRDTPRVLGPLSGYHLLALALAAFGAWRLAVRAGGRTGVRPQPAPPTN